MFNYSKSVNDIFVSARKGSILLATICYLPIQRMFNCCLEKLRVNNKQQDQNEEPPA